MRELVLPPPTPRQLEFMNDTHRYVGYGGARGGGKSWAMRTKLVLLCLGYPGMKVLLLRRTMPELRENHIRPLMTMLAGVADFNKSELQFTFPNGSRLAMGSCDTESDIMRFQGQEYDVIGVEEATNFTWSMLQAFMLCNRSTRRDFKPRMYLTANPGGVGHSWFKRLFIDRRYENGEVASDYSFIPATVDDNPILMAANPEYVRVLDALPARLRTAYRYGSWDLYEGQYFEELRNDPLHYADRRYTHVISPFEIPRGWSVYRSFDFGYARPFSCGWYAVDNDGVIYRFLEYYGCGKEPNVGLRLSPVEIFTQIAEIEHGNPQLTGRQIRGIADPSIWDASRGESVAETAAKLGIYFDPGDNHRVAGWMQVRRRLRFDRDGIPGLYVFSTCREFIRTIPTLCYSAHNPEDLDTTGEDHIADELRYLCMARPAAVVGSEAAAGYVGEDPLGIRV